MAQGTRWGRPRRLDWDWMLPEGAPDRPTDPEFTRSLAAVVGRWLVGTGAVLLLFVCYQLWGTGIVESYAQRSLAKELDLAAAPEASADLASVGADASLAVAEMAMASSAESSATVSPPTDSVSTDSASTDSASTDSAPTVPIFVVPPPAVSTAPTAAETAPVQADQAVVPPRPDEGDPVGRIELPSLGVTKTIVHGVRRETLRTGPGHYPSSALPGENGNVAIAGHRTTHGAPFADIDQLAPDDEIHVDTPAGRFTYQVVGHPTGDGDLVGHQIVDPSAVEVIANHGDDRLTLTACHPKFSARQRIIVSAVLVSSPVLVEPAPEPTVPASTATAATALTMAAGPDGVVAGASSVPFPKSPNANPSLEPGPAELATEEFEGDSLGWQPSEMEPTVLWTVVTALTLFAAWVIGRFWPARLVYPAAGPVAAVPLFICFFHIERLLPAY